jgi:predicted transcriptional regulator of viral defense system
MASAAALLVDLQARGRYAFTAAEAQRLLKATAAGTRVALARLKAKGEIVAPFKGYYLIVPPEYRRLGCLPAEQFVPAYLDARDEPYYVALLSAARVHGAGHHAAQVFQVVVGKPRRALACGGVRVTFVTRGGVRQVPTSEARTPRGTMRVSTPEATAVDLVGFPQHAGGLDNVATILKELRDTLDPGRLVVAAAHVPIAWAQRLGHLLDAVGAAAVTAPLGDFVRRRARSYVLLSSRAPRRGRRRDRRWRVWANARVETEA